MTCVSPNELTPADNSTLTLRRHTGREFTIDVTAEEDHTLWQSAGPPSESQIIVWTGPDRFIAYTIWGGEPDWSDPFIYQRCPVYSRESYDGAIDGEAGPFTGNWRLLYPSRLGDAPDILATCANDDAIEISRVAENEILHDDPVASPANVTLDRTEGHTAWRWNGTSATWQVVWVSENTFHAFTLGMDGLTDWREPFIYERCEG